MATKVCTLCHHPDRKQIDRALVAGKPFREIVKQHETNISALSRHRPHVSEALRTAVEEASRRPIADQMRDLLNRCIRHLEIAELGKKPHEMAVTSREVRETLKTFGQLTGELDDRARVNVLIAQQQTREAEAVADLQRLMTEERIESARLLAKAKGTEESTPIAIEVTAITVDSEDSVSSEP